MAIRVVCYNFNIFTLGTHWPRRVLSSFHAFVCLSICLSDITILTLNTLRLRQNGRLFSDDIFKCIFLNENGRILIKISLKFVPKVPINNIPALVQIMAWRHPGDKPLSELMMVSLLTHICVTRPQWVKSFWVSAWNLVEWCRVPWSRMLKRVPTGSGKPGKIKFSGKVMELGKSHTDKSSPSIRNLALIGFASHLVSCIHSTCNTSDYEL